MKIGELRKVIEKAQETLRKETKGALKEAFKEFFEKNPTVEAMRWSQYTPHWNDGEACTFSVNAPFSWSTKETLKESTGDNDDGFVDEYTEHDRRNPPGGKPSLEAKAVMKFSKDIVLDEAFEAAFGDHVQVTATRKGFEVEEFEHD